MPGAERWRPGPRAGVMLGKRDCSASQKGSGSDAVTNTHRDATGTAASMGSIYAAVYITVFSIIIFQLNIFLGHCPYLRVVTP